MKLLVFLLLPCLSLSELSQGFAKCSRFFLNNDPPQFTPQWANTVQEICQCVWYNDNNNNKQIMYLYATLYNRDWRIPIYSAYVFYGSVTVGRCDAWYIEPQLDGDPEQCMAPKGRKTINNQAVNSDYDNSNYDRGHLYPVQHTHDPLSMLATSTLTNAAPQDSAFNRVQWKNHERNVINDLASCVSLPYVVTGIVPDTNKPKLKLNVNFSKYYWRATCCLKNGVYTGQGYYGPDSSNVVQTLSIKALQTQLAKDYNVNSVIIFPTLPTPTGAKRPRTGGCI
ncbi:endonuclease domain-containing 1 protein-like [Siphateles boraxobius]|uniref:endonuclease domain-containing 1 protein-like n=1 Tax=Siphateles boraxobius TaxID=180520 RepID=UPI004063A932